MTGKQNHKLHSLPTANYSSAIARAVEWLGDRYLLAKPINRSFLRAGIDASIRTYHGLK